MLKSFTVFILAALIALASAKAGPLVHEKGDYRGDLSGITAAIFHEEGFPSQSPREAEWYGRTLEASGAAVNYVDALQLSDENFVTAGKYDLLLIPTGGFMPADAETTIGNFLNHGGIVAVDGNIMASGYSPPEPVAEKWDALGRAYSRRELRGDELHDYHDFVYRHGLVNEPKLFRYSEELGRWVPKVERFYYHTHGTRSPGGGAFYEFELEPWPNHANPGASMRRPFDENLVLNPILSEAGLIPGLPDELPTDILVTKPAESPPFPGIPGQKAVLSASSEREDGFTRFAFPGHSGFGAAGAPEYANNLLVPVYLFREVSGGYSGRFAEAGRDAKDRESDFYIVRYHTALRDGGTLLHFGRAGAHLLRSDEAGEVLLASLRLARSKLPGERNSEFIGGFLALDRELRGYQGAAIRLMDNMDKLSRALLYSGDEGRHRRISRELDAKREEFEELSSRGEHLYQLAGERADRRSHAERVEFTAVLREAARRGVELSEGYGRELAALVSPPPAVEPEAPFGRLVYGFSHINPTGITRLRGLYPLIAKLGFSKGPTFVYDSDVVAEMYREHGITTSYRMSFPRHFHIAKRDFEMGILDPDTGEIKTSRERWFEDTDDWSLYEEDISWFLQRIAAKPGISHVSHLSERNMGWSLWGERMERRFRSYLERKHGSVEEMNRAWGADYGSFEEVVLPRGRPETRQEHGLWEDWTRYREIYYLEEEVKPEVDIIGRHAPGLWRRYANSSHRHNVYPSGGVNFYEVNKISYPSNYEMGMRLTSEIMAADIAGFHNRNLTMEWGAFYFPPPDAGDQVDRLREYLWRGIGWGQVGIQTFMGSRAGRHSANFINLDNLVMPLGWAMKGTVDEFTKFQHIILDGEREEPQVRILYSPTTRRHTSWPGVERDISMEEAEGYYDALNKLHVPVRVIDEGAVMDGYLSRECRLLILPRVEYMNGELLEKVLGFVEAGGSILVNPESGRYNEYGEMLDSLISLAGVADTGAAEPRIVSGAGVLDASGAGARALNVMFPDETEVVLRYADGGAAVTITGYGEGSILVSGVPFGRKFANDWRRSPEPALSYIDNLLRAAGVKRDYKLSDMNISVWPWEHGGAKYLVITSPARTGMVRVEGEAFPFRRAPRMTPFTMKIKGDVRLTDYVLGKEVPGEYDGEYTRFSCLAPSPGGMVFEVREGRWGLFRRAARRAGAEVPASETAVPAEDREAYEIPFEGRLFSDETIQMGGYTLSIDVRTGGGWEGDVFLNVEKGGAARRREIRAGEKAVFGFLDRVLEVDCLEAQAYMPANIKVRISEREQPKIDSGCTIREEPFEGRKSVLMENEHIRVRILPELGGRIIEFISRADGENHLFCDRRVIAGGRGSSWADYGGLEENAGAWPGPFWNIDFDYELYAAGGDSAALKLHRSEPITWSHGSRGSGSNSLEKIYELRRGEPFLRVNNRVYNHYQEADTLRLRIRPQYFVGGSEASLADLKYYFPLGAESGSRPYGAGSGTTFQTEGSWAAVFNGKTRHGVVKSFNEGEILDLYTYHGPHYFNYEMTTPPTKTGPAEYLEFCYRLCLLRGLEGLTAFGENLAVYIGIGEPAVFGWDENMEFTLESGALYPSHITGNVFIRDSRLETIWEAGEFDFFCSPGAPKIKGFEWNTGRRPDGDYFIKTVLRQKGGGRTAAVRRFTLRGEQQQKLLERVDEFSEFIDGLRQSRRLAGEAEDAGFRAVITRIAVLVERLRAEAMKREPAAVEDLEEHIQKLIRELDAKTGPGA